MSYPSARLYFFPEQDLTRATGGVNVIHGQGYSDLPAKPANVGSILSARA